MKYRRRRYGAHV